jgi:hypothetical protein
MKLYREVERSTIVRKASRKRGIDRLMVYLEGLFAQLFRRSLSVPDHRSSREAAQCRRQPILAGPAWYCGPKCTTLMRAIQRHALGGFDERHGGRVEACFALDH